MDVVIAPGVLCLLMSMDRMAAVEWLLGVGADVTRAVGREFLR